MNNVIITSCTIEDGAGLAHNNIPAFWTDPNWVLIWRGKTLEYVTSQAARRMPALLLRDRLHARHQKAVNSHSGAIVGYARWILPTQSGETRESLDRLWAAAQVPAVSKEVERNAKRELEKADWSYDHAMDELDAPMIETKNRLMEGKRFLRT
jgi:hypothetical protein